MADAFTNFAKSTLVGGLAPATTTLTVQAGDGALFPAAGAGQTFRFVLQNAANQREVCVCTLRTGDVFNTITRAQEGTAALTWNASDRVGHRLTAAQLNNILVSTDLQQNTKSWCGTAGGTVNALTLTPTPAVTAMVAGHKFIFKTSGANLTPATMSVSGLATFALQNNGVALNPGDLEGSKWYEVLFDGVAGQLKKYQIAVPTIATTKGDLITYNGTAYARVAVGTDGQILTADSVQTSGLRWDSATPRSYLAGFGLTNSVSDLVNNIDIAPGACRSAANDASIVLAATLTKQLSAVWAVGNNQGMRASGAAIANTTYSIFAIRRPDTGVVDIAADTSVTGANIAANTNVAYTQIRRIGFIVRAGATIVAFIQNGDDFYWSTPPASDFNAAGSNVAALQVLTVPIGAKVKAYLSVYADSGGAGNQQIYISDPACADVNPAVAGGVTPLATNGFNGAASQRPYNTAVCWTDTSGRVRHRETNTNPVAICVLGWMDRRDRDA